MTTTLRASVGAASSQYKIQCTGSSVLIGDREFLSATDALEAYVAQYENRGMLSGIKPYARTVNDLLNPKSVLRQTAERSLDTGVRATDTELRLADTKDSINESFLAMKKSVALKAEAKKNYYRKQKRRVDEALNKSADLMQQLSKDEYPNTVECPSDVGSLATDVLVSMDPAEGYTDTGVTGEGAAPSWKSKHVFGYKRPRNRRSKTLSSIQISHDLLGITADQPQQSFTAQPTEKTSAHVTFQDESMKTSPSKEVGNIGSYDDDVSLLLGDSLNTSRQSRSPSKKLHERSRSVSPSILKRERKLFESGLRDKPIPDFYTDFNTSSAHKAPSWVDTMNTSDVSDTDWTKRDYTTSRPPPSWINDMDNSDITSLVSAPKPVKKLQLHDLLRPLPVINTQDSSYNSDVNDTLPPPGLTYQDLLGDTSKLKVHTGNTQTQQQPFQQPTLSDKLMDLKSKTTAALERYHERQNDVDTPSKYSATNAPRCSSLDAAALMKGIAQPGKSDITGASPIGAGDNDSTVTALSSPGKVRRAPSPDTDIVLEGDRPWEKTASYKPPVSMHDTSRGTSSDQTYSGGSQPGSLEALKNMIFKLQQEAVHTDSEDEGSRSKLSERVHKLRAEAASLGISVPAGDKTEKVPGDNPSMVRGEIPSLKGYNFQGEPGGQSLEKALVHLDRLKSMVSSHQQAGGDNSGMQLPGVTPLCANMENV